MSVKYRKITLLFVLMMNPGKNYFCVLLIVNSTSCGQFFDFDNSRKALQKLQRIIDSCISNNHWETITEQYIGNVFCSYGNIQTGYSTVPFIKL